MLTNVLQFLQFVSIVVLVASTFAFPIVTIPRLTADPLVNQRRSVAGTVYTVIDFMVLFVLISIGITAAMVSLKENDFYKHIYVVIFIGLASGVWLTSVVSLTLRGCEIAIAPNNDPRFGNSGNMAWIVRRHIRHDCMYSIGRPSYLLWRYVSVAALIFSRLYIGWAYRSHGLVEANAARKLLSDNRVS